MDLPGQRVWHRNGQRSFTVVECDGGRVFIALMGKGLADSSKRA